MQEFSAFKEKLPGGPPPGIRGSFDGNWCLLRQEYSCYFLPALLSTPENLVSAFLEVFLSWVMLSKSRFLFASVDKRWVVSVIAVN